MPAIAQAPYRAADVLADFAADMETIAEPAAPGVRADIKRRVQTLLTDLEAAAG